MLPHKNDGDGGSRRGCAGAEVGKAASSATAAAVTTPPSTPATADPRHLLSDPQPAAPATASRAADRLNLT